jgi:transcriptional regulator with XRE-family HTH domain
VAGDSGDTAHGKRRRLATELRLLRDVNGITGRELARRIGISQSKVSRIEAGVALPSIAEVTAWTQAVGATAETEALLERLTDAARTEVETWHDALQGRHGLQDDVREREVAVRRTRSFEPTMVPGLLQTPDYAQRVLTMFKEVMPQIDVPSSAAERINRQRTLYEEDKEFEFLIGEGALRWRPGPPRLLLAQLDRIATMSTKSNVAIGIIPLLAIEATGALPHPFTIYEAEGETAGSFVQVETTHAELTVKAPDDVAMYESQWSSQRRMARFGDEARTILKELSAEVQALGD